MLKHIPPRLSLANLPTPMRELQRLGTEFGAARLWLKQDELSGLALSGNKVRKLEFLLADALQQGCDTIITCGGIQSNHCRATAFACAQLGLNCHLILRDDRARDGTSSAAKGNHLLSMMAGAEISLLSNKQFNLQLNQRVTDLQQARENEGAKAYFIPVGGSNGMGLWGYFNAAREILAQCHEHGFKPDLVVCASGSGGTQAGLTLGFQQLHSQTEVLGMAVCDSASYFQKKIVQDIAEALRLCGMPELEQEQLLASLSIQVNDAYIGPGYALADDALYRRLARLAAVEALILDPVYTGKAMHGLLSELERGRLRQYENIVFVHTGGAFGLFAQADELIAATGLNNHGDI